MNTEKLISETLRFALVRKGLSKLSLGAFVALDVIKEGKDGLPTGAVAATTGKTAAYMTIVGDQLERAGLVRRVKPKDGDRRVWLLQITDRGRELHQKVIDTITASAEA